MRALAEDEYSDEELEAIASATVDSLSKQRARNAKNPAPRPVTEDDLSDEELEAIAAHGKPSSSDTRTVARDTPTYALTDYADSQDTRGPYTPAKQKLDTDYAAYKARGGDDPFVQDPIAGMVLSGTLGAGAGGVAGAAAGRMLSGASLPAAAAAEGGVGAITSGATDPSDVLTAIMMSGIGRGAQKAMPGTSPARAPRTQAEIDAAALAAVPDKAAYKRPDLPRGSRGTEQMATDAEAAIRGRLQRRKVSSGLAMEDADAAFADLPPVQTQRAIEELENIRAKTRGGAGPTLDSDPVLAQQQRQLTSPNPAQLAGPEFTFPGAPRPSPVDMPERLPQVSPAELRNIQRALTEEAKFAQKRGATQAEAQLQQGAGVLSRTAREHDPTGRMGEALDAYGAEEQALTRGNELLYDRPQSNVPTEQSAVEGGRSRLGRAGTVTADDVASSHANERRLNEVAEIEPASKDLISQIRARNTSQRRGMFTLPNLLTSNPLTMAGRTVQHNASNLAFKLWPPQIDAAGQVAARTPSATPDFAIPLEIQLMLMQQEQERRNAGQ